MKVALDRKRCEGHGVCENAAPGLFTLDENAELIVHFEGRDIPSEFEDAARDAVRVCPVAALIVEDA